MIVTFRKKINALPKEFILFLCAVAIIGFSLSVVNTVFNNFLNETFRIGNLQRGILELPRELPGFLVVFFSAAFFFLSTRRMAAAANLIAGIGLLLLGIASTSYGMMLLWLFIFSSGQHIFLPLSPAIGMEFAGAGKAGKRLGQLAGAGNLAAIAGSFIIFLGFRFLHFNYIVSFCIAAVGFLAAAVIIFSMKPDKPQPAFMKFTVRKEYRLFYWLNILYGTRKQLFLTFAPWVLVTVFNLDTAMVATLLTIGGVIGIFFNPLLGRAIDKLGERFILMGEAVLLVFVCLGYGFSRDLFGGTPALIIACACFIVDQLLMSVGMARATYIRKIAVKPEDISQTLTMGVTIDHLFSIAIALISGFVWTELGYQYVFLIGAVIAAVNFFSASRVWVQGESGKTFVR